MPQIEFLVIGFPMMTVSPGLIISISLLSSTLQLLIAIIDIKMQITSASFFIILRLKMHLLSSNVKKFNTVFNFTILTFKEQPRSQKHLLLQLSRINVSHQPIFVYRSC